MGKPEARVENYLRKRVKETGGKIRLLPVNELGVE